MHLGHLMLLLYNQKINETSSLLYPLISIYLKLSSPYQFQSLSVHVILVALVGGQKEDLKILLRKNIYSFRNLLFWARNHKLGKVVWTVGAYPDTSLLGITLIGTYVLTVLVLNYRNQWDWLQNLHKLKVRLIC